jgi:hypothetical protein
MWERQGPASCLFFFSQDNHEAVFFYFFFKERLIEGETGACLMFVGYPIIIMEAVRFSHYNHEAVRNLCFFSHV